MVVDNFGATGPIFVGQDTHALSQPALVTVLEVLAGNGVVAMVDADMALCLHRQCLVLSFGIMKVILIRLMVSLLHHPITRQIMGALSIMLPMVALRIR